MLGVGVVDKSNICQSLLVLSPLFITGTLIWGNGAVSVVWILLLFPGHTFYVLPCFTASCRDIPQLSQVSAVLQWILTFNFIWNNINGSRKPFISQLVYIKCSQNTNDDANWHLPSKSPCFILHNMRRLFFFFFAAIFTRLLLVINAWKFYTLPPWQACKYFDHIYEDPMSFSALFLLWLTQRILFAENDDGPLWWNRFIRHGVYLNWITV